MTFRLTPLARALGATMVLTLAACGGGGGGAVIDAGTPTAASPADPATPPAPVMVTLTGAVMGNGAIRNALVCLDLNANAACDADEPASARTGADGAYSLAYDASKLSAAQVAAASLIAPMVPGAATDAATTIDAAEPAMGNTERAYVLRQVAGKSGQINPLTTLVAQGIAEGMSEADARANVAIQLKLAQAGIDDYQPDPPIDESEVRDSARLMAQAVQAALEEGATLRVGDQSAAQEAAAGDLALLRYTDAGNFLVRTFNRLATAAGGAGAQTLDARSGMTNGSATDAAALYNFAYLAPDGWRRCDGPWSSTLGNPSRSTYCGASESVGFTVASAIDGQAMGTIVTQMQADPASNVINNGLAVTGLAGALGNALFPAGSAINTRVTLALAPSISINSLSTDGRPQAEATTLEQLVAAHPASAAALPGPGGTLTLGLGSSSAKNLRVAFTGTTNAGAGTVQFYECDLDASQSVASNCAATQAGTYAIASVNGTRVMRFAGHAPTVMNNARVYAEVRNAPGVASGDRVYQARESKPDFDSASSDQKRLNPTAWAAMKAQLGL